MHGGCSRLSQKVRIRKHCCKLYTRRCLQTNDYDRSENKFRLSSKIFLESRLQFIRVHAKKQQ